MIRLWPDERYWICLDDLVLLFYKLKRLADFVQVIQYLALHSICLIFLFNPVHWNLSTSSN